jgi:hypothetical protein
LAQQRRLAESGHTEEEIHRLAGESTDTGTRDPRGVHQFPPKVMRLVVANQRSIIAADDRDPKTGS